MMRTPSGCRAACADPCSCEVPKPAASTPVCLASGVQREFSPSFCAASCVSVGTCDTDIGCGACSYRVAGGGPDYPTAPATEQSLPAEKLIPTSFYFNPS